MEADGEKMDHDSEMMQSVVEHQEVPVQDATVMLVREPEEEMMSITRKEAMACQEMEERLEEEEPTSVDRKPEVVQREVPNEDAVVKPVNGRKKRQRGKRKAARRRGEPKKLTRGDCGSRMKLAAAWRKVSRRATVAWRKRNIFRKSTMQENWGSHDELATNRNMTGRAGETWRKVDFVKNYSTRVSADQETWKGRTSIKNVGGRRPLCQKKKGDNRERHRRV
jgi:hypothetical protein